MKRDLDNRIDIVEREEEILSFWEKNKVFTKLQNKVKGNKTFSFYDGPITANNKMGVHHGWGRSIKDAYQRFHAMKGYDQRWQNGFDGQGLWVEVEVEKDLGLNSKKEIEDYGIDKFAKKCRSRVEKYSEIITNQSRRLGQWMDWQNSYQTMSDNNIEHIWHFLKTTHEKKMLYRGEKVLPWCLRCGTSLSSHELYDNYKLLSHKAVFIKYKLKDEDTFLLVWTTTPWTLLANVAIAVDPDLDYVKLKDKETDELLIIAKERTEEIEGKFDVIETFKGKKLVGKNYLGLFDDFESVDAKHKVISWSEVGADEGTGLVHIAPGCGQEDFELSKDHDLDIINPIDEEGNYLQGFGDYSGKSVSGISKKVFEDLKSRQALYKIQDYKHRYPLCWRCDEELVYRVVKEWFIKADPVRDKMIEEASQVNWQPNDSGKRMENWLENMGDWNISRKRYWGLPLPIYDCQCGQRTVVGSLEELTKLATDSNKVKQLPELHRPWIDEIKIKCPNCGKSVSRISEVGDCWLDAGIVPYSTLNYLGDKDYWQKWFPADFITEMREQVRLWFYAMLFMSVVLEGEAPYKQVLTHSAVSDEKGEEMHKSKGNAIWFDDAASKMGADVMRWMYLEQNPAYPLKFGFNKAKEIKGKFNTWWNSLYFLVTYANIDDWQPDKQPKNSDNVLDRWLISRLNQLVVEVEKNYQEVEIHKSVSQFDSFLDDLSNWYIRRSRRRFWKDSGQGDKDDAYSTLYRALKVSAQVMAPFFPFFSENIYSVVRNDKDPVSVHLTDYPKADKSKIDTVLMEEMSQAREVVYKALSERSKAGIKVRQPLASLTLEKSLSPDLNEIIKEEVNIKEIKVGKEFSLDLEITDKLKREGIAREVVRTIQTLRKKADYDLSDRIEVFWQTGSKTIKDSITENQSYIEAEVLAEKGFTSDKKSVDQEDHIEIEGDKIWLGVKK
jgi:isoleucyl-tRNA synthetase